MPWDFMRLTPRQFASMFSMPAQQGKSASEAIRLQSERAAARKKAIEGILEKAKWRSDSNSPKPSSS